MAVPASIEPEEVETGHSTEYYSTGLRERFHIDGNKLRQRSLQGISEPTADIGYYVDEAAFHKRCQKSLALNGRPTDVPSGWPVKLHGARVWSKESFADESEYVYYLTLEDKQEIGKALECFRRLGSIGTDVARDTFPLPVLGMKLSAVCHDIYDGRGFAIVRGLNPDDYSVEDMTVVYLGVSSYIGERRGKQDQRGSMLMHVICRNDEDRDVKYTEDKPFHTDTVTDCLCLFAQSLADDGGRSVIASAWTIYNELAATRPDLIHILADRNWPFDTFGRDPSYYKRALMYFHKGKLITSFSRRLLVGHEPYDSRTPGIPGLTEIQAEALDAVHFIGRKHEIKPRMERGDLRFINNMAVLHRREAFTDSVAKARHLVRIWLNNEMMCWKLPQDLRIAWARVFEDDEREAHWDLVPPREGGKILRVAGTCD